MSSKNQKKRGKRPQSGREPADGAQSPTTFSSGRLESSTLEFKRELPKREDLLATLCALANTAGGELQIGVDDAGNPVGLEEQTILANEETISSWIAQGIRPLLLPLLRIQRTTRGPILIIQVGLGSNRPYGRVGKDGETVFVRIGSSTRQADAATVARLRLQSTGRTWDALPVPDLRENELSADLVREFWTVRKEARDIPVPRISERDWLSNHRFLVNEAGHAHPTHAGVLFFHPKPQEILPQARVDVARFAGTGTRDFLDKQSLAGPIWKLPRRAVDFLRKHLPVSASRSKSAGNLAHHRIESLAYPEGAFRELFLNALCHRAYEGPGSHVHVAIFDDILEITNPGSLPDGLELVDLGTGIQVAQDLLRDSGLPAAKFHLKGFFFQVSSVWRWNRELAEAEENVLRAIAALGRASSIQIAENLGIPDRTVRRQLLLLVNRGLLIRSGTTRSARYGLA